MTSEHQPLKINVAVSEGKETVPVTDEIFELLSKPRNRYVLKYIKENPTATVDQLTDVVTGAEAATKETILTAESWKQIRIHLHHVVLPRLDDEGYIEYDHEQKTVSRESIPQAVFSLLESTDQDI